MGCPAICMSVLGETGVWGLSGVLLPVVDWNEWICTVFIFKNRSDAEEKQPIINVID